MPRGLTQMSEGGGGKSKQNAGFKRVMLYDDGESSKLRFLTDADEMYFDWFHKYADPGDKWPTKRRICLRSALNAPCEDCDNELPSVYEWMAWVYVYTQNLGKAGDGRTPVTVGRRTYYQENCNEVRLMRYASFHKASVKAQYERLSTLLDYEFEWIRQGGEKDNKVSYVLERGD